MKRTLQIAILLMIGCFSLSAQTTQIVQLTPEDAAKAKTLYEEKSRIEEEINSFRRHILENYLSTKTTETGTYPWPKRGWEFGFAFTTDYRFVVPLQAACGVIPRIGCENQY